MQNDKTQSLYNQCLAWEPEASGSDEAKGGDNAVHQIVPPV